MESNTRGQALVAGVLSIPSAVCLLYIRKGPFAGPENHLQYENYISELSSKWMNNNKPLDWKFLQTENPFLSSAPTG